MWVVQLIIFQLICGYVIAGIIYTIWRLSHPGQKPW